MLIEKEIADIMDDNKRKALQAALSQIEKQFGKGSIMRLGEHEVSQDIQVVSTGSLGLDIALGAHSNGCCGFATRRKITD